MSVRASHILIKHDHSRNPVSRRTNQPVTMSQSEAEKELAKIHETLLEAQKNGELAKKFAEIAATRSDCSSYKAGGDLGSFGRGQMQAAFENATYALKIGEMSGIVNSDSGAHLILRTA